MLELEHRLTFEAESAAEFFAELPARAGVCLIEPRSAGAEPFLIRTQDLRRRLTKLLGLLDAQSKRLNLREFAGAVRYRVTGSRFEQTLTFYQNAKLLHPSRYRDLLRMRPPAVLKVNLKNAYPRCFVTRRIPVDAAGTPIAGAYYGPFAKRKIAERFVESVLDFFKVRRCQIKIRRDPTFPGCLYSEMKMCLAPCFAGCSQEEYGTEVQRLVQFLDTGGNSLRETLEKEREQASEDLDFERASAFHKRVEKLDEALRSGPELARRVTDINAVILQRGAEDQTIGVYAVRGGYLAEPLVVRFAEIASAPKSAEQLFRDYLESSIPDDAPAEARGPKDLSEHLWLLARWYYGNEREGEIFFHNEPGRPPGWPYRRILRACSRLLAPEPKAPADKKPAETAATPAAGHAVPENAEPAPPASAPAKTKSSQRHLFDKPSNEGVT